MARAQSIERPAPRRASALRNKAKAGKATASVKSAAANVINLRTDEPTRALIDRAASAVGQNRTEFMLASARAYAQEVLLNEVYFQLNDSDWQALNAVLANPPPPNAALKRLMARTPSWA